MRFKSARSWSRHFTSAAVALAGIAALPAFATMTVTPVSGGHSDGFTSYYLTNAVTLDASSFLDDPASAAFTFKQIDLNATFNEGPAINTGSLLVLDVSSDH